ncbi:hypothetical protein HPB47_010844 [Ixodes persulcatus]|uniref:Uncharacterized protein n=1 Tax=Ixodes persulcatus TaxID=34615 RepID=A0AC60NXY4_IXOPE|nr:hypothetical protein HPB47_010844 [Ixodes persulcatus]
MDGPNVNLKFLRSLKEELRASDTNHQILDIGSCGLHVVNGAFKAGHAATHWDLVVVVKKDILQAANTSSKLLRIDLEKPDNFIAAAAFDIGFAAKNELRKIQKPSQLTVFPKSDGKVTFEVQVDKRCKLLGSG